MMVSDLSKLPHNLSVGANNIIDVYNILPPTEHDPHTFTVDMPYYTVRTEIAVLVYCILFFKSIILFKGNNSRYRNNRSVSRNQYGASLWVHSLVCFARCQVWGIQYSERAAACYQCYVASGGSGVQKAFRVQAVTG